MNKKVRTWVTLIAVTLPFLLWLLGALHFHDELGNSYTLYVQGYLGTFEDFFDDYLYLLPCTNIASYIFSNGAQHGTSLSAIPLHSLFLGLDFALWVNFGFFLIDFILWLPRALSKVFNKYEN